MVLVALAGQAMHAGDRRSSGAVQESAKPVLVASDVSVVTLPGNRRSASTVGLFEPGYSAGHWTGNERDRDAERAREHKPLTLFRFDSKFGEVAVRPAIGKVNGAQFSLGF